MSNRTREWVEHRLARDVRKFRQGVIEEHPNWGRSQVQEYVEEYATRRRAELLGQEVEMA